MNEPKSEPVVIVTGPPRSGTSLMMRLLERAGLPLLIDETRPADASNPRGYFEFAPVRASARDTQWLNHAGGRGVKVIDRLLGKLPLDRPYRVIVMNRPAEEVIASQNRMLARLGEESGRLPASRLKAILELQTNEMRQLLSREACFDWIPISYPRLVQNPRKECLRILDFLNSEPATDATVEGMVAAVDASLYRERA
ncbi:MAG: hypothetical protein P8M78_06160 [Myxococcota bacterium]|nr:hypothetical protein [Myxococcota bacterium]